MSEQKSSTADVSSSTAACFTTIPDSGCNPLPVQRPPVTLADLIDRYMTQYAGRDSARLYRLSEWQARLGHVPLADLTDEHVFQCLEVIAAQPARLFMGKDADGKAIYKPKRSRAAGEPVRRSGATVNRYHASLAAVFTWAIKKRVLPRGTENPLHKVERHAEGSGVVRFLSVEERSRLLAACKVSEWPRLYALVLLALTTGARRGELLRLSWADIDLGRCEAHVSTTKNGEPKVLPLVRAVAAALDTLRQADAKRFVRTVNKQLVFASRIRPDQPYSFEAHWRAALRDAGIKNFRFHDLRHTCASYLAQEGASLLEIADVMGHRQLAMVKRYAHLTTKSKAQLVNRVLGDIA